MVNPSLFFTFIVNKKVMLYWLIEEIDQLEEFLNRYYNEVFVEIIPYSNTIHPTQNDICAIYIRPLNSHKGFIIPLSHSEALSIDINEVESVLNISIPISSLHNTILKP